MSFHYSPKIVTDGLVLYLDAANPKSYPGTGTSWFDLSPNIYTATLTGGVSYITTGSISFSFDGVDDFVDLGNISALGFTDGMFTVSCWFYIPSTWTAGYQYPNLFGKGASAGWDTNGWTIYIFRNVGSGTGYTVGFGMRNSATTNICSIGDMPTDVPINVSVTINTVSIKLYINGVLRSTATRIINPASTSDKLIIARGPSTNYFPGKVYNAMAYNTVLSELEILQNYTTLKSRFGL